ncbi:MAG: hypothetical protein JWQ38_1558 [Flavipsychrobacter sp.]|nr:hypothetical protein [Flavipsychrobacter sp.]
MQVKTVIKNVILIISIILCASCGTYRQNVANIPMPEHKGQLKLGVHQSFTAPEAQGSFSLSNKVAVLANYSNFGERSYYYSATNFEKNKHYFGEVGVGLYRKADSLKKVREVFLLGGKGYTSHFDRSIYAAGNVKDYIRQVSYSRIGLQADLGNQRQKISFVFSPRIFVVHYYDITDNNRSDYKDIANTFLYVEPVITLNWRVARFLSVSTQFCTTMTLTRDTHHYNYYYEYAPFNISIGLIFNMNCFK